MTLAKYTILPGQYVITSSPSLISTILGSCVAVCLWDKYSQIAGMNHYLLPGSPTDSPGNATRGFTSIPLLIQAMVNRKARIEHFEAKIFGGCNSVYRENDLYRIGDRNAAIALAILDDYKIPVSAQHVGGSHGRKIVFNTATGKVRMRLLPETASVVNEKIHKGLNY